MKNKVYVIVKQGLGNQLFQLAYGLWQVGGDPERIVLDTSSFLHRQCHGGYALRALFGPARFAGEEVAGLPGIDLGPRMIFNARKFPGVYFGEMQPRIEQTSIVADGWFQNYAYVAPHIEMLRDFYEGSPGVPDPADADFFASNTVVGVHFRRNDYLEPHIRNLFGIVDYAALLREMRAVVEQIRPDRPVRIAAFSDSPLEGPFDRIYMREATPTLQGDIYALRLMSLCDHLICSNSTFSLWAGYLSRRAKTISLPSPWARFGKITAASLLPPNGRVFPCDLA